MMNGPVILRDHRRGLNRHACATMFRMLPEIAFVQSVVAEDPAPPIREIV